VQSLRSVPDIASSKGRVGVRAIAADHGFHPPLSLTNLIPKLKVKQFHANVTAPDPDSLGGTVDLTIFGDGSYNLKVHMHDSGAPSYSFRLAILLHSTGGQIFALYSTGTVHGTIGSGSRDFDDPQNGVDQTGLLAANWEAFAAGSLDVRLDYQDNFTSALLDVLGFVATTATLGGPAALVIWGGKALQNMTGVQLPANLGWPGLIAAEAGLVLAGPTFFLPLFVAGVAATAALMKLRPLRPSEIAEAKRVFLDTLDYDSVTIANFQDTDGRSFAAPGPSGNYLIASSEYYDDFLATNDSKHTFIHELTHVWQMQHAAGQFVSCDAVGRFVGQHTLSDERKYERYYFYFPNQPWSTYNPEQQAQVVSDWYMWSFYNVTDTSITGPWGPQDAHYIDENVRAAKP